MSPTSITRWIPLESNPDILNAWANKVGLVPTDQFHDVYGLDDELLSMVPQPVKAVVLLFPIRGPLAGMRRQENEKITTEGQPPIDPTIIWVKQTISNACGTMGLLHALANSNVTIEPESPLSQFIDECKNKTPLERSKLLEETPLFAAVHEEFASSGQSAVPENLDVDLHFTCFVQAPAASARAAETETMEMRLIELDGTRNGPIDRGTCTNLLKDAATYVKEKMIPNVPSAQFSMMALAAVL